MYGKTFCLTTDNMWGNKVYPTQHYIYNILTSAGNNHYIEVR